MNNPITAQQALLRLQRLCGGAEKCIADVRNKLMKWQINPTDADKIIEALLEDKYINEERYAIAFVRDKSRFSRWGIVKIQAGLRAKGISAEIIATALTELESLPYKDDLEDMLEKKNKTVKAKNQTDLMAKLIRFGLSRGFEYNLVYQYVSKIVKNNTMQ